MSPLVYFFSGKLYLSNEGISPQIRGMWLSLVHPISRLFSKN